MKFIFDKSGIPPSQNYNIIITSTAIIAYTTQSTAKFECITAEFLVLNYDQNLMKIYKTLQVCRRTYAPIAHIDTSPSQE